ncbi:MAG: hypothetical protein K6G90_01345 [Clostridia bacterium]|nr:hypothetical protein [Clostridia bacterium]
MKKVLAIVLAAIMLLSVMPFAFAEEPTEADAKVAEWKSNDAILLTKLLDELTYSHYKYVIDNNESIRNKMNALTAFGFAENAWLNYVTKEANADTCKAILLSLIEAYEVDLGHDYLADIEKALDGASTAMEVIEKANQIFNNEDLGNIINSDTWGSIGSAIGTAITVLDTVQEMKAAVVKAYAEILSVQMANAFYIELLDYIIADETLDYAPLKTAAAELKYEATTAINEQLAALADAALQSQADEVTGLIINAVADTNVYTAAAKKIYGIGVKVADVLWNASDLYALYDNLIATFYAENSVDGFTTEALAGADSDKAIFAVNALLSTRNFGEQSMYNLLEAEAEGVIGRIKKELGVVAVSQYVADLAELDLMHKVFFDDAYAKGTVFGKIAKVYCPVNVVGYAGTDAVINAVDGVESVKANAYGAAIVRYNAYCKDYVKVMFLSDAISKVNVIGTDDGYVTYLEYVVEDGAVNDYSITELQIGKGDKISIADKAYAGIVNGLEVSGALNDDFVLPEGKEVTAKDVVDATVEVGKQEAKSFIEKIKAFFENLFASLKNLFKF